MKNGNFLTLELDGEGSGQYDFGVQNELADSLNLGKLKFRKPKLKIPKKIPVKKLVKAYSQFTPTGMVSRFAPKPLRRFVPQAPETMFKRFAPQQFQRFAPKAPEEQASSSLGDDMRDQMNLSKFSFKRAVTPPRKVRAAVKKTIRYAGASSAPALFMTASQRKKVFGLSDKESKVFEKHAKVVRTVAAVVATVYTGGAAAGLLMKAGPLAASALKAAPIGSYILKAGSSLLAVKKSGAGDYEVKEASAGQLEPGTTMPASGFMSAPSGMMGGMPAPVAGEENNTGPDASAEQREAALRDSLKDLPAQSPNKTLIGLGVGAVLLLFYLRGRK